LLFGDLFYVLEHYNSFFSIFLLCAEMPIRAGENLPLFDYRLVNSMMRRASCSHEVFPSACSEVFALRPGRCPGREGWGNYPQNMGPNSSGLPGSEDPYHIVIII
jgi:hypothetical protein